MKEKNKNNTKIKTKKQLLGHPTFMSLCCVSIRDEESQEQTWVQHYRCVQSSAFHGPGALVPPAPTELFCCTSAVFQCTIVLRP